MHAQERRAAQNLHPVAQVYGRLNLTKWSNEPTSKLSAAVDKKLS